MLRTLVTIALFIVSTGVCAENQTERMLADPRAAIETGLVALQGKMLPTERVRTLLNVGWAAMELGEREVFTEVILRLENETDAAGKGIAEVLRAENQRNEDHREESLVHALRGAELLLDAPSDLRQRAESTLCAVYVTNQRFADATTSCNTALAIAQASGDEYGIARTENIQSFIPYYQGKLDEAIRISERALARAKRMEARGLVALISSNLAQAYLDDGRIDDALGLTRRALDNALETGRLSDIAEERGSLARVLHAKGRTDEALSQLARGIEEARKVDDRRALQELLSTQSSIAEASGRLDVALQASRARGEIRDAPDSRLSRDATADLEARYRAREQAIRIRDLDQERRNTELELREAQLTARRQRELLWTTALAGLAATIVAVVLGWSLRAQRRLSAELETLSNRDALTGIENRRAFMQRLDRACAKPASNAGALMILDLDHFKSINDRFGHPFGDTVLLATVSALRKCMPDDCHLARIGGEEFALLCESGDSDSVLDLAERMRLGVAGTCIQAGHAQVRPSISIGVAVRSEHFQSSAQWLRAADQALYAAKNAGRNRVVLHGEAA